MIRKWVPQNLRFIVMGAFILFAITGFFKLTFLTDFTAVLPKKLASVQAVQSFQKHFDDDHQIVVLAESVEDYAYEEDIADLAAWLSDQHPNDRVVYRTPFDENPELFTEEIARIWSLSDPQLVTEFRRELIDQTRLKSRLDTLKTDLKNSFDTVGTIKRSYDPLGMLDHPALAELTQGDYNFESDDGKARFFFIKKGESNTVDDLEWVEAVRKSIVDWNRDNASLYHFSLTGSPVYNSEVRDEMNHDLYGTSAIALCLIVLIFFLAQRSFKQLLVLFALTSLTLALTLGLAGWFIGELTLVSIAFASILIGLVVDYGIVIIREGGQMKDATASQIRRTIGPSVGCAALTSCLIFSALLLSSFNGVKQLGLLILIGLIVGTVLMTYFVPFFVRYDIRSAIPQKNRTTNSCSFRYIGLVSVLLLTFASIAVILSKGFPPFEFELSKIQPQQSEAAQTHDRLKNKFHSWTEKRVVLFSSSERLSELKSTLYAVREHADEYVKNGLISEIQLPVAIIPEPNAYQENRTTLHSIQDHWDDVLKIATSAGFSRDGLRFNEAIFGHILRLPESSNDLPKKQKEAMLSSSFYIENEGTHYFRGTVDLKTLPTPELLAQLPALNSDNITMAGWQVLNATLEPLVRSDFMRLYLPASILLILSLAFVFRKLWTCLLILATLAISLLILNAIMVMLGYSWNILSSLTIPLMVGLGVDYSIHLIFSLRRSQYTISALWRGVGTGIIVCGLSSAVGFYALTFAENALIRSLGFSGGTGVIITLIVTLSVIPYVGTKRPL